MEESENVILFFSSCKATAQFKEASKSAREYVKQKFGIGDICGNELFLKRTPTSDRMLAESELRYPYEGSKTLMHVFDSFDDKALILELLNGMYAELPDKKPKKAK